MMLHMQQKIFFLIVSAFFLLAHPVPCTMAQELLIDAVVASVDGQPITLQELCKRLSPPRTLNLSQVASDAEARTVLDRIILERLILAEGAARKMQVSDSDVDAYLNEIAERNKMSRADFEIALKKEGIELAKYKEDIKLEIMKSRLASAFVRGSVSVSDEEVDKYIEERVGKGKGSSQIQLRQILISGSGRSSEEARTLINEVKAALDKGDDFAEVAKKYSESPERSDGGFLGVVEEKDLSPQVFDVIFSLKEGEISPIVDAGEGYRIFKVEKRFGGSDEPDERLLADVRNEIQKKKMEEKFQSYFTQDLYKQHSIDKKI